MTTFAWSLTFYSHKQSSRQYVSKGLTQSSLLWRSTAREKPSHQYPFQWVIIWASPSLLLTQLQLGTVHLVRYCEPGPDITGGHREVQGLGSTEERYCSWRTTTLWAFGNLEGVSSRGALCSNSLWHKFKEPQDWPVDDRARRKPFPSNVKDLEELAEHLSADMASIPNTFFDNVIRKEHIYLLVQISHDLSSGTPISTSASYLYHNILSEGAYELVKQNYLAWCGVPSRCRLFQVDVGRYKTRSVYALRDEVLRQSGFRDSECNLWKVRLQEA